MSITGAFREKSQEPIQKDGRSQDSHAVIEILDNELHQIFPTPKLAQMIECGKDFEFLQQPEDGKTGISSTRMNETLEDEETDSMPSLCLLKVPSISRYPYVKVSAILRFDNIGSDGGNPLN